MKHHVDQVRNDRNPSHQKPTKIAWKLTKILSSALIFDLKMHKRAFAEKGFAMDTTACAYSGCSSKPLA